METKNTRDEQGMRSLAFELVGAFSHLQTIVDEPLALLYLRHKIPETADFFYERAIARIRDSDRPKFVLAVAKDVGSDANLDCFSSTYSQVKQLRDSLAHAAQIEYLGPGRIKVRKSRFTENNAAAKVETVDERRLTKALNECGWLDAQVTYVLFSGGLVVDAKDASGRTPRPVRAVKPSRKPADWDGRRYEDIPAED